MNSVLPGPPRFQVYRGAGTQKSHSIPTWPSMDIGILEAFSEAASKLRPVPKQPFWEYSC